MNHPTKKNTRRKVVKATQRRVKDIKCTHEYEVMSFFSALELENTVMILECAECGKVTYQLGYQL